MDKDDCAVIASVQNVPADGVGVMVLPVLRVDRPVDKRSLCRVSHGLVRVSVGRADVSRIITACCRDELLCLADLTCDFAAGERVEVFVVLRVACQLVPLRDDAPQRFGVALCAVAGDEERRLYVARSQLIEKRRGIRAGAVVKCDGDELSGKPGGRRRNAKREEQKERQRGAEDSFLFHGVISF